MICPPEDHDDMMTSLNVVKNSRYLRRTVFNEILIKKIHNVPITFFNRINYRINFILYFVQYVFKRLGIKSFVCVICTNENILCLRFWRGRCYDLSYCHMCGVLDQ